jgi:hypothetical protein
MRSLVRVTAPLAALVLMASIGMAHAGSWYYKWSCTGRCSPGRLVIEGGEGPFATREECEWVRDRDTRADEFVAEGNLGGLSSCEEVASAAAAGPPIYVAPSPAARNKVRIAAIEVGVALGTGWSTTGEDAMTRHGAGTVGLEIDSHTGRDIGGGALQIGIYGTRVEAPMLGAEPRTVMSLPLSVGLALTPKVFGRGGRSVRLDLGASLGGMLLFGCDDCPGAVFDETIAFGYSLKAGVDVFTSKSTGFGIDVLFPRWQLGAATAGNLELESPTWMLRLSVIGRPDQAR